MKSFRTSVFIIILSMLSAYYFISCDVDHGLGVDELSGKIKHGIKGTIIFNGQWPENIAETRLVAAVNFPPDPADTLFFSDPIPFGIETFDYEFSLEPDTFRIIGVITREMGEDWNISNLLAVYSPIIPGTIIPNPDSAVVVESDTSIVEGVNIFVDFTKGSISGTVTFVGEWPPDAAIAGIAVYERYPPPFILGFSGISILPVNISSSPYKVFVPPASYEGVIAIVLTEQNLSDIINIDLSDIVVGIHYSEGDTTKPGVVSVSAGKDTAGIDISANLDLINK